jgi:hypothetical protein
MTTARWKQPFYFMPFKVSLINNLVNDADRNKLLVSILKEHADRKIVVLGERIPHLKMLMEETKKVFPNKNIVRFFGSETKREKKKVTKFKFNKIGKYEVFNADNEKMQFEILELAKDKSEMLILFKGKKIRIKADTVWDTKNHLFRTEQIIERVWSKRVVKLDEYEDPPLSTLHKADIIFATDKKMTDATDIPHLDTIMYATPFGSALKVRQTKGRVERAYAEKQFPLVIDIMDMRYTSAVRMFNKRIRTYKSLGMQEIRVKPNNTRKLI